LVAKVTVNLKVSPICWSSIFCSVVYDLY